MTLDLDKSQWERVRFGDVVRNANETLRDADAEGIDRIIAMEHLDPGELRVSRWGTIEDGTTFTRRVRPGQTLFGKRRAYQRKAAFAEFDAITSGDILTFEAIEGRLLPEFLPFIVQSDRFYDHALGTSAGSLSPRTNWRDLAGFEFDLPPLPEQQRLADLLWAVERHRSQVQASKPLELEQQMLAGLVHPSIAPAQTVASIGSVVMGRQRSPQHASGDHMVPYLRVANVGDNILRLDDVKEMSFTPDEQIRYSVDPGDILLSEGQSRELVGQSVLITSIAKPMCFQNTLIRFRANAEAIRPEYAQSLFRACLRTGIFSDIATQTTSIAHLGAQRFAQLRLPVPSLAEQDEMLDRLASVRSAIDGVQCEVDGLDNMRSALSHAIFGGGQ